MRKTLNAYSIVLKSGVSMELTREEELGKTAIGLWVWASKRTETVVVDFAEGAVLASEIVMVRELGQVGSKMRPPLEDEDAPPENSMYGEFRMGEQTDIEEALNEIYRGRN